MSIKEHPPLHVPVLLNACIDLLKPTLGENYLDLTAGYGGHASVFLDKTKEYESSFLVDRDNLAIAHLKEQFEQKGVSILHQDFVSASLHLIEQQKKFDLILVDLGVSSPQLDNPGRGFSFTKSGPLDMRMDRRQSQTAANYLNKVSRQELIDVIKDFGEEKLSVARRYADAILEARPLDNTEQLAEIIVKAHVGGWQKIHPATRTFQAIRIALNDELGQISCLLPLLPKLLNSGGRVGIISFHSLEDRLVKKYFNEQTKAGYEAELRLINKKPRIGTEDVHNLRARSAKLRAAVKI